MSATNSTGRANHSLVMTFCSPHAVIDFDVPPTASHKNNYAKLVRANAVVFRIGMVKPLLPAIATRRDSVAIGNIGPLPGPSVSPTGWITIARGLTAPWH